MIALRGAGRCLVAERASDALQHGRMYRGGALYEMCWHLRVLLSRGQVAGAPAADNAGAAIRERFSGLLRFPPKRDLLLFEVATVLGVHQHQVEKVANGELFVDVAHGGRQVVAGKEYPDWNAFSLDRCTVHDFVFCYRLVLGEDVGA